MNKKDLKQVETPILYDFLKCRTKKKSARSCQCFDAFSLEVIKAAKTIHNKKLISLWADKLIKNKKSVLTKSHDNRFALSPCCSDVLLLSKPAFTIAEILIALTIIVITAVITIPALQANFNEKAWATQKKSLYNRMSAAITSMPSINGYGIGETTAETNNQAALSFVTVGLSKAIEIKNICDSTKLVKCGISSKYTTISGNKTDFPKNLSAFNNLFTNKTNIGYPPQYEINTKAAAFETANGESVAVFYNPRCINKDISYTSMYEYENGINTKWRYTQPYMCANFIYDLNGKKGPNKVGKDMGFITVIYPTDSEVVAPLPLTKDAKHYKTKAATMEQADGIKSCKKLDERSRLPNYNELISLFYNYKLLDLTNKARYWSSTIEQGYAWSQSLATGGISLVGKDNRYVRCVKR